MKALRTLFVSAAAVGLLATAAQAQDKTIKIGALFPMSGPGSYFGAQDKQGVELALEQLNKAGVNGYKFVVQYEDSSCSPLPATQAAKRLIEQFKPDVIIGEECSDATLAVMPVVEQAKVPLLNAGSSSIKVTEPGNPWTFRIMPNEVMQGINLAENASKRMKAETAVLLFENTNAGIGNARTCLARLCGQFTRMIDVHRDIRGLALEFDGSHHVGRHPGRFGNRHSRMNTDDLDVIDPGKAFHYRAQPPRR